MEPKYAIKSRKKLLLYGCAGLGVNMLSMIVGSYLCSALLVGGFVDNVENWTYLNQDLVIAGLWAVLAFLSKSFDGIVDIPLASFTDNLKTPWGRRRPAILGGWILTVISFVLFLVPLQRGATLLNTLWFVLILTIFYSAYTMTMLTYYATFSEIIANDKDRVFLSNVKSVCDVVYFSLSFALVPVFVNMGWNIRWVALLFLPLSLTMMIPLFLLKEDRTDGKDVDIPKREYIPLGRSLRMSFQNRRYVFWLCILFVMNMGLQLFLSGINEFFSTTGINMTFVMASAFAPVPFTLLIYNHLIKKKGLKFAYQYALLMFSAGMSLMFLCHNLVPENLLLPFAIFCSLLNSFGIGAFFSVTYMIPSQLAEEENRRGLTCASSMYFAIQGLFEAVSAALASHIILVFLKQKDLIHLLTLLVALFCMAAFCLAFRMPRSVACLGKETKSAEEATSEGTEA